MLKNDTLKNGTSCIGLYGSVPPWGAKGPLGFWYCKIDSLNQTLIDISKIGMRANEPKKL